MKRDLDKICVDTIRFLAVDMVQKATELLRRGAYVLDRADDPAPDVILIASGSEVGVAVAAEPRLRASGVLARLVSMPCWRLFEEQPADSREQVLPSSVTARLAIEAASPFSWKRWTGSRGATIAIDRFGAPAPGNIVLQALGFTVDAVVERALAPVR